MTLEISRWDPAESIRDKDYARLVLEEAVKDGNAIELADTLSDIARAYGMAQLAKQAGLPVEQFFEALNRAPSLDRDELLKLIAALGVKIDTEPKSHAAE